MEKLCLASGSTHPRTHKQRISALLKIIEAQQGHSHSTKKYLQQLQRTGQTHTSVEYNVAIGIIRVVAQEVDGLAALMDEYTTPDAKASDGDNENGGKSGARCGRQYGDCPWKLQDLQQARAQGPRLS